MEIETNLHHVHQQNQNTTNPQQEGSFYEGVQPESVIRIYVRTEFILSRL